MTDLTYAVVGGPPDDWANVEALLDGYVMAGVCEANATEGWIVRARRSTDGDLLWEGDAVPLERLTARVFIRRRAEQGR